MNGVYRLLLSAPDKKGLVAIVSSFIADIGGNINEAHHFLDKTNKIFFMRIEIDSISINKEEFINNFRQLAKNHKISFKITSSLERKKVLLLGSQTTHCVAEILHKASENEIDIDIVEVWSNHKKLKKISSSYNVNFRYFDLTENKDLINNELQDVDVDLVVLARYMQIIPQNITDKFSGRMINIHHSFLPSFKGGNPYKKAESRGVKLIGATCHFVNENLDDGAIIEQNVARVDHNDDADNMKKIGLDIEKITLATGVKLFSEDRIIIFNNKTIIFN